VTDRRRIKGLKEDGVRERTENDSAGFVAVARHTVRVDGESR